MLRRVVVPVTASLCAPAPLRDLSARGATPLVPTRSGPISGASRDSPRRALDFARCALVPLRHLGSHVLNFTKTNFAPLRVFYLRESDWHGPDAPGTDAQSAE